MKNQMIFNNKTLVRSTFIQLFLSNNKISFVFMHTAESNLILSRYIFYLNIFSIITPNFQSAPFEIFFDSVFDLIYAGTKRGFRLGISIATWFENFDA